MEAVASDVAVAGCSTPPGPAAAEAERTTAGASELAPAVGAVVWGGAPEPSESPAYKTVAPALAARPAVPKPGVSAIVGSGSDKRAAGAITPTLAGTERVPSRQPQHARPIAGASPMRARTPLPAAAAAAAVKQPTPMEIRAEERRRRRQELEEAYRRAKIEEEVSSCSAKAGPARPLSTL